MEFNFLVFPAPKNFSIDKIYSNIVLIPQKKIKNDINKVGQLKQQKKHHVTYNQFCKSKIQLKSQMFIQTSNEQVYIDYLEQFFFQNTQKTDRINKNCQYQKYHIYDSNRNSLRNTLNKEMNRNTLQKKGSQYDLIKQFKPLQQKSTHFNSKLYKNNDSNLNSNFAQTKQVQNWKQQQFRLNFKKNQNFRVKSQINIIKQYPIYTIDPQNYIICNFRIGKNQKVILYFHANGQDITSCDNFVKIISQETGFNILSMQYRGYSLYGGKVSPYLLIHDGSVVINYLLNRGIKIQNIILIGRSIGSSIAFSLASSFQVHSLTLLSPFLSLQSVAQHLYGSCGSCAIKQTFNNQEISKNTKCPILIIHGMQDTLVPYEHSVSLMSQCKSYCRLKLIPKMTHSKFSFKHDFIENFLTFIIQIKQ